MGSNIAYQPENYQTVIPYIHATNAAKLMAFIKDVFEAKEIAVYSRPDGSVGHAAFRIGDSVLQLADAGPEWPAMPCALQVYVPDADAVYGRALKAGATSLTPPTTQFYGDRTANVRDVCGNNWYIATQLESLSKEEIDERIAGMTKQAR